MTKAVACSGREIPTLEEAKVIAQAWDEILQPIWTSKLNECYVNAVRNHDTAAPLGAHELIRAWTAIHRDLRRGDNPQGLALSAREYDERVKDISRRAKALDDARFEATDWQGADALEWGHDV